MSVLVKTKMLNFSKPRKAKKFASVDRSIEPEEQVAPPQALRSPEDEHFFRENELLDDPHAVLVWSLEESGSSRGSCAEESAWIA